MSLNHANTNLRFSEFTTFFILGFCFNAIGNNKHLTTTLYFSIFMINGEYFKYNQTAFDVSSQGRVCISEILYFSIQGIVFRRNQVKTKFLMKTILISINKELITEFLRFMLGCFSNSSFVTFFDLSFISAL